jgi:sulfur carrier protein
MQKINIIINGQNKILDKNITIQQVSEQLSIDGRVMAAAVNMQIVKQDEWDKYKLKDNDKLELLDFVGGG